MKFLICLIFAACAASKSVYADEPIRNLIGYGKTTWGMTPQDVISAEAPRAHEYKGDRATKNGVILVTIDELLIAQEKFDAVFLFSPANKKLIRVLLRGIEHDNDLLNRRTFDEIEKLLTEKYGAPTFRTDLRREAEGKHVVSWNLGQTKVELVRTYLGRTLSIVSVQYDPVSKASEAGADL